MPPSFRKAYSTAGPRRTPRQMRRTGSCGVLCESFAANAPTIQPTGGSVSWWKALVDVRPDADPADVVEEILENYANGAGGAYFDGALEILDA